jgi:hypothetical protein
MTTPVGRRARADRALCPNRTIPAAGILCNSLGEVARRTGRLAETVGGLTRLDDPERSHRIDQEEFWGGHRFGDFDAAAVGLRAWEATYNYQRFSVALQGRTPAEKLAALTPAPAA